jgi:hypothetical protein
MSFNTCSHHVLRVVIAARPAFRSVLSSYRPALLFFVVKLLVRTHYYSYTYFILYILELVYIFNLNVLSVVILVMYYSFKKCCLSLC